MLFSGSDGDDVSRLDGFDRAAPTLHATRARCHDRGLTEWVRVPAGPSPGFERYDGGTGTRRIRRLEQRIDSDGARKIFRFGFTGRLRTASFDLHINLFGPNRHFHRLDADASKGNLDNRSV
jgi:hypothetical protein